MSGLRDYVIIVMLLYVTLFPANFGKWLGTVVLNAEHIIYSDCDCTEPLE